MIQPIIQPIIQLIMAGFASIRMGFKTHSRVWILGFMMLVVNAIVLPAQALPDPYIAQYLKVQPNEVAVLPKNGKGETQTFTYANLLKGKELFGRNCQSCHVGGATLARPELPLSLTALKGATPSRDTIDALVTYMRHPLSYGGEDDNYGCREIKEAWLNQTEVETIAAFVLRAADQAAGWGTSDLF